MMLHELLGNVPKPAGFYNFMHNYSDIRWNKFWLILFIIWVLIGFRMLGLKEVLMLELTGFVM